MPGGIIEQAQYHVLFPSSSVDMVPGPPNLQAYAWAPVSPSRMASTTFSWFSEETSEAEIDQIIAFNDQVSAEDVALVDSVQEGLDSGVVEYGRLMPESEALIGRFQRLLYDALAGRSRRAAAASVTLNVAPEPSSPETATSPPCASTIAWTIASPSPEPPPLRAREASTR